jgi:eukaryotic-like serine/threonine-protein kinase
LPSQHCPTCKKTIPPGTSRCPRDGTKVQISEKMLSLTPDEFVIEPGKEFDGYIAEQKIGIGGMAEVWRCRNLQIGKRAAIKILNKNLASNQDVTSRFLQEARSVNAIKHRGVVDIFGFGQLPDGRPYFAMEFLEGKPLHMYSRERGPLPVIELFDFAGQMCRALNAAHERGIIHRDLKPENIFVLLEQGFAPYIKILDFGIANLTQQGEIFGTPAYMSPEQCEDSKNADRRSDIYSLGIVLFELLTGKHPFMVPGDKANKLIAKQVYMEAPSPSQTAPELALPTEVDQFFASVLAKDPQNRPQDCLKLLEMLMKAMGPMVGAITLSKLAQTGAHPVLNTPSYPLQAIASQTPSQVTPQPTTTSKQLTGQTGQFTNPPSSPTSSLFQWFALAVSAAAIVLVVVFATKSTQTPNQPQPAASITQKPQTISMQLHSSTPNTLVYMDGALFGKTPLARDLPYSEDKQVLRFEAEGFQPMEKIFIASQNYTADISLLKIVPATIEPTSNIVPIPIESVNNPKISEPNNKKTDKTLKDKTLELKGEHGTINPFKKN